MYRNQNKIQGKPELPAYDYLNTNTISSDLGFVLTILLLIRKRTVVLRIRMLFLTIPRYPGCH